MYQENKCVDRYLTYCQLCACLSNLFKTIFNMHVSLIITEFGSSSDLFAWDMGGSILSLSSQTPPETWSNGDSSFFPLPLWC